MFGTRERFGSFTVSGKWCQVLGTWHKHGFELYRKVVTGTCYYFPIQFNAVLVSCTLMCCMYMLFCQAIPQPPKLTQVNCQRSHEVAVFQLDHKKMKDSEKAIPICAKWSPPEKACRHWICFGILEWCISITLVC